MRSGQQKNTLARIISIGLERPSTPRNRLLVEVEVVLRHARDSHPGVRRRIAWAEAQGLANVSLCFFGATDKDLTKSDHGMSVSEISIQRQRMLTFGDALRSALGANLDKPQQHMAKRMVRDRRQGFGQLRFRCGEGRHGIGHKGKSALVQVRARRSDERVDIVGIGG